MKKTKLCAFLSGAAALSLFAAAFSALPAAADDSLPDVSDAEIAQTVFTGERFDAPDASITYRGKTAEASARLLYPSGKATAAENCLLDEAGMYTVEYTAVFDGFPVQEERTFVAVQHLFESDGDTAPYYGAPEDVPDRPGIVVTLGKGETFRYNRMIDFREMTAQDMLIEMYVLPEKLGTADARQIIYTFTDTENENNVLTITQQAHYTQDDWAIRQTYLRAGATGQPESGWEWTGGPLHSGDKWGTCVQFSMHGQPASGSYKTQNLNFSIDYENLRMMTNYGSQEIIDLNDPAVFDTLWEGFEKGTAYLSVTCGQFNSSDTTFVLTNVGGQPISDGNTVAVRDDEAPVLTVEKPEQETPQAVVGSPYKLYGATAADNMDKSPDVTCRVFVNYGSNMQAEYDVADGAFTPDRAGIYTVEYTAVDYFGNKAVETIQITAGERPELLTISVSDTGAEGVAGELFTVADYSVDGTIGNWEVAIEASVEADGETYVYEVTDGQFRPEYAGEYTVRYTVSDYIGSASCEYKVKVEAGSVVKMLAEADLPDYMLVGATYRLPAVDGVDYSGGKPAPLPSEIEVSGARADFSGNSLTPAEAGLITVSYVVRSGGAEDRREYTVRAVDAGYGGSYRMQDYFYGDGVTMSAATGYVEAATSADARIDFIKTVAAGFQLTFSVDPLRKAFERLTVTVCDSVEPDRKIELVFYRNRTGMAYVSVNGGQNRLTEGSWNGDGVSWDVLYDASLNTLSIGSYVRMEMPDDFSFPSGLVYVSFGMKEVSGPSAIRFERVNNQALNDSARDVVRPQISVLGSVNADYTMGEKVELPAAAAADVLDPSVNFSLTVSAPDGSAVWTDSGRELRNVDPMQSYVFTASQYGQYVVELTATDGANRRQVTRYTVNVTDKTLPEIALHGNLPTAGKAGEGIALPGASVTDDSGAAMAYCVYLVRPDGVQISLFSFVRDDRGEIVYNEDGTPQIEYYDGFVPGAAGKWTVIYYAADGSGNTAIRTFEISVE